MKEQKAALRREIRARIAALPEEYLRESDAGILENVLSLPEFCRAGAVFAYLSVERECDTRRIIDALMESERAVALPRSRPGGSMDFALYDGRLAEGLYGIPQPPEDAPELRPGEGDLILVPALCCDAAGVRLGHGGGYYDRWLAGCSGWKVGLCRAALLQDRLPRGPYDIPVDLVVTDRRILHFDK